MKTKSFTLSDRIGSFQYAFSGIWTMLKSQHNAWIHAVATLVAVLIALLLGLSSLEWALLVLTIAAVWIAEALNTAFEFLADVASPDFHPLVKRAKDVAASAVLLSAGAALTIGILLFLPRITAFFEKTF